MNAVTNAHARFDSETDTRSIAGTKERKAMGRPATETRKLGWEARSKDRSGCGVIPIAWDLARRGSGFACIMEVMYVGVIVTGEQDGARLFKRRCRLPARIARLRLRPGR
jgi:hypothetical protein